MKTSLFIALALAALPGFATASQAAEPTFEQRCERDMTPRFDVTLSDLGHEINNTVSSRVLGNKSVHKTSSDFMLGMTALETHTSVLLDGPAIVDKGTGRECVSPRILVELVVPRMSVYVAREFSPASCSYRQVLEHEMRHVQLYREQFPNVKARVRAGLAERFGERPLYARHGAGLAALQAEVDLWLRPFIRRELASMEVAQAAMDTEEESFRLYGACQGELASNLTLRY